MVTKGPALVLRHYLDYGRRPMADFDIVIKKEGVEEPSERCTRTDSDSKISALLFHVCVHGSRLNRLHPLRWSSAPRLS